MAELLVSGFAFDAYVEHELEVFFAPRRPVDRFCSKEPSDVGSAVRLLRWRPDLWVVCMVRDPRDVVVSRHAQAPDKYWANLGIIRRCYGFLRRAADHPRFVVVRYEDLALQPDTEQARLQAAIPFLERRHDFSRFHEVAAPADRAVSALGGVRAINPNSIGRWRDERPRLKAQIERYGPIDDILSDLGYETDPKWRTALEGVPADNGASQFEDRRRTRRQRWRRRFQKTRLELRYAIGIPARRDGVVFVDAAGPVSA